MTIIVYKSKREFLPLSFLGGSLLFSCLKVVKSFFYHSVIIERYFLYDYLVFSFGLILFLPMKIKKSQKYLVVFIFTLMSFNYFQENIIIRYHDFEAPLEYFVRESTASQKIGYMGHNYRHLIFYFEKYSLENRYSIVIDNKNCDSIGDVEESLETFLIMNKFLLLRSKDPCTFLVNELIKDNRFRIKQKLEYDGVKLLEFE